MAVTEKAPVEQVTMTDARVVEFAGKRKLLKDSFVDASGAVTIRLDFRNGETRSFQVPASLTAKFAAHGAEQKLGDEIAGVDDVDDCVLAVDDLIGRLNVGEWSTKRESNGMAGTSILVRALAEFRSIPVDKVKAFLANKTQAQKIAMRDSAELKPIVVRLEQEKAAKSKGPAVDTAALFTELD